ncbi:MAG: hypothetical protein A2048_10250 [Deltaproteobacteria bacterium GWA2_45_12]|nr:MAG: hypothetical protein A2048_10250 [Deltaproteobacteria bacterium GWA2_45_12]
MSILLDTSVLVASFIENHVHHGPSLKFLERMRDKKEEGYVSCHGLAECYAALTAYPIKPSISPALAVDLIQKNIKAHFKTVALSSTDYLKAIWKVKRLNLRSGAIYDALIFQAGLKKKVQKLATWNFEHFKRLIENEKMEIVRPA